MKTLISALTTCLVSAPVLAHPGHDHSTAPAGEWHMLLWIVLGAAALFTAAAAALRYTTRDAKARSKR